MRRGGKRETAGCFIAFGKLRVAGFFLFIQIAAVLDQRFDLLFDKVPVKADFLIVTIPANQDSLAAVIHKTPRIIRERPASAAEAILILQVIGTLFCVRLRVIQRLNPHFPIGKTGAAPQHPVNLFIGNK